MTALFDLSLSKTVFFQIVFDKPGVASNVKIFYIRHEDFRSSSESTTQGPIWLCQSILKLRPQGRFQKKNYKKVDWRFTLINPPPPLQKVDCLYFFFYNVENLCEKKIITKSKDFFSSKGGKDPNSQKSPSNKGFWLSQTMDCS